MPANLKTMVTLRKAVREFVLAAVAQTESTQGSPTVAKVLAAERRLNKARASYERALRKVFDGNL